MINQNVISIILNIHESFVPPDENENLEAGFYKTVINRIIPLLELFEKLNNNAETSENWHFTLAISPELCQMLSSRKHLHSFALYLKEHSEFSAIRTLFREKYNRKLLEALKKEHDSGKIELFCGTAVNSLLPFTINYGENVNAQLEVAQIAFRKQFGALPTGFFLPQMAYGAGIDASLRAYNYNYTVIDTHTAFLGTPPPLFGAFFPVKTSNNLILFVQDFNAKRNIADFIKNPGKDFAKTFIEKRQAIFDKAAAFTDKRLNSTVVLDTTRFMENPEISITFLEELVEITAQNDNIELSTPRDYLSGLDSADFQTLSPEFSAETESGYADFALDASNDWIHRHITHAILRMEALSAHFPNATGLKERVMNQAAREILLAQSLDWPRITYDAQSSAAGKTSCEYALYRMETHIRNFTTIFEALSSGRISTKWLTTLEMRDNLYPNLNYRVFRKKQ
jgi:1,4-alpha-glucan branching enzyme